jgi:tetratricopeptide (TPR) repeat protein
VLPAGIARPDLRLAAAVVATATAAVFAPSVWNGFVDLDDQANLVDNPWIRGLGSDQLRWMFTTFHLGHWQPLSWLTLAVDYRFWGLRPGGYHLTSLLIHAASAVVLLVLGRRLLAAAGLRPVAAAAGATLAALLWSIHPLRVESVVWATERRDVLSGLFTLLALVAYARAPGSRRALAWTLAATVAALLAKASAMVVPAFLVVLDVYPLGRLGGEAGWTGPAARRVWVEKLPFVALAALAAAVAARAQRSAGALRSLAAVGVGARLGAAMTQSGFYLWKMLVPVDLLPMYGFPLGFGPAHPLALAGAATAVGVGVLAVVLRRRCPGLAAAFVAYLAAIAPTLGFVQSGPQMAADRYTYLAGAGWCILAGGLVVAHAERPWWRVAAAVPLLLLLGVLTAVQATTWRDARTLWTRTLALDPGNPFAQKSIGDVARASGDVAGAIAWYQRAVAERPYAEAETNLASLLAAAGRWDEAFAHYEAALRSDPANAFAHTSYGVALSDRGRLAEAEDQHRRALALDPGLMEAHVNLGTVLDDLGRTDEALAEYREALRLRPSAEAYDDIGAVLLKTNRPAEAADLFRRALALRPDLAVLHENLGYALRATGDRTGAVAAFREALRIDHGLTGARDALAALEGATPPAKP